jgi:predicted RNase H-like nuclease
VQSILAIDPAWTSGKPSGIALLRGSDRDWTCIALAPSYAHFVALAAGSPVDWSTTPRGEWPGAAGLLNAAGELSNGAPVDLVTIDMPVAISEITGRRLADAAISRTFGGRGCSTHSPSATRPGAIGAALTAEFAELGYPLATSVTPKGLTPSLVEVYPHPALLELMRAEYRVPYKVGNAGKYWRSLSPPERRQKIVETWREIVAALEMTISGADLPLPSPEESDTISNGSLKRFEDALDALICGWIGIQYLLGLCTPHGDETAAIWTP